MNIDILFRNSSSGNTNYMWGGCQFNVKDRYQQYSNENNIYVLENVEELSMWRKYDRFWSHYYDNHWDQPPEFKDNLYWGVFRPCKGCENFVNNDHSKCCEWLSLAIFSRSFHSANKPLITHSRY